MRKKWAIGLITFHLIFIVALGFPWPLEAVRREHSWIAEISPILGLYQWWSMFSTTGKPGTPRDYTVASARTAEGRAKVSPGYWYSVRLKLGDGSWADWPVPQCLPGEGIWSQFRNAKICHWIRETLVDIAVNGDEEGPPRNAATLIGRQAKVALGREPLAVRVLAMPLDRSVARPVREAALRSAALRGDGGLREGRADFVRYWPDYSHTISFLPGEVP
jgi:hypothetical protein